MTPQTASSYSRLQQAVAAVVITSIWGCATTPPPPSAERSVQTSRRDTQVIGRLVLVRSGVDQTPYASAADHALCLVPDGVPAEQAKQGLRPATLEADGRFRVALAPGVYKLYSQHRLSQTQWIAVLPMAKLTVSSRGAEEVEYAGTLRLHIEPAAQAQPSNGSAPDVRRVTITLADEGQQQALVPGTRLIPALLQLQANIALVQPQPALQACSARELLAEPEKPQDGDAKRQGADVAKGVLAALLLIPLAAILLVLWVLSKGDLR